MGTHLFPSLVWIAWGLYLFIYCDHRFIDDGGNVQWSIQTIVCVFFWGGGGDLNAIIIIMSIIMIASSFDHCIGKLKSIPVLNEGSKKDLGS